MKVYAVFSGEYSDRGLDIIFSTKEKAENYIVFRQNTDNWQDVDSTPTEYELDEKYVIPKTVLFQYDDSAGLSISYYDNHEDGFEEDIFYMNVKYNINKDIMIKSANDKLAKLKARELGI
jgi:hypothetical protein